MKRLIASAGVFLAALLFLAGARTGAGAPAGAAGGSPAVFVDVSGSMKGFTSRESVRLVRLQEAIDRSFAEAALPPPVRYLVGNGVEKSPVQTLGCYKDEKLYSANQSRLDMVLATRSGSGGPVLLETHPVTVMVTDGMQSAAGKDTPANPCLDGPDPYCIRTLLRQAVGLKYGVWMVFVLLPFNGLHLPDEAMDASHWARVTARMEALSKDPFYSGVAFKVDGFKPGVRPSYHYRGVKPLLAVIITKRVADGRAVAEALADGLARENFSGVRGAVQAAELAPLNLPSFSFGPIVKLEDKKKKTSRIVSQARRPGGPLEVSLRVTGDDDTWFQLPIRQEDPPGRVGSPGVEKDKFVTAASRAIPPEMGGVFLKKGAWYLHLKGRLIPRKDGNDLTVTLTSRPRVGQNAMRDTWWGRFSARNNYEAPERLYGLADLVLAGYEAAVVQDLPPEDRIVFKVDRKD